MTVCRKAYNERAACDLLKTWPSLKQTDVKRITKFDYLEWRARFDKMYSPNSNKIVAQAKAAYSYLWWASSEAIEFFLGQANEPVQIVPSPKRG